MLHITKWLQFNESLTEASIVCAQSTQRIQLQDLLNSALRTKALKPASPHDGILAQPAIHVAIFTHVTLYIFPVTKGA